jgi:ribose transport system substrate-binding protein
MNAAEDMMTANPDLAGIFVANEPACIGAARAIEAAGKAGDVKLVCFDAAEEQISALQEGTVHALVVQNPFAMGYESVKAAIDHLEGRTIESRIDTGVAIVTKDNLADEDIQKLLNPQ